MFIGREQELSEIREALGNDRFESILIYGRRRVGKTELIFEALDGFDGTKIYFEAAKGMIGDNIEQLNRILQEIFDMPFHFATMREIFQYVAKISQQQKVVFVLDEFPYLVEAQDGMISALRDLIDQYKRTTNLKIIISGSYVDMMKKLIEANSETFGRFTHILPLQVFDYYESSQFYPEYSNEDKLLMYSVFGGVAFFNSLIDPSISALENMHRLLHRKNSVLQLEIEKVVAEETNKIQNVNTLIHTIGTGATKYSDIRQIVLSKAGSKVSVDYLINRLIDMEIIEKVSPINMKDSPKQTYYRFKDPLFEYYYKYIYPNATKMNVLRPEMFYDRIIKNSLKKEYLPSHFEKVATEFLIRRNKAGLVEPMFYDIGTYFFNDRINKINRQFDVVTKDDNGYTAYECKYTEEKIDLSVVREEEYQIRNCGLPVYRLGFIAKAGFTEDVDRNRYALYSLDDFYDPNIG